MNNNCKYSSGCDFGQPGAARFCKELCCYQELHGGQCFCKKHAPRIHEEEEP